MSLVITTNGNGVTIDDGINSPVNFVNVHYSWFFTNGALNLSAGKCNFIAGIGSVEVDGNTPANEADLNTALGAVFPADGGSGASLFPITGTGTATGDVTADLDGKILKVQSGGNDFLSIDPTAGTEISKLQAVNTTANYNYAVLKSETSNTDAAVTMSADFNNGAKTVIIIGLADNVASSFNYSADTHLFTGTVNLASIQEFADNAAAITGGLSIGDLYRTGDSLKIVH